jgi:RimJ/RimL family protein N-acetyltransferase
MLRLGATFEGILRKHLYVDGEARDTAMYSIVDDDWPTINRTLRGAFAA